MINIGDSVVDILQTTNERKKMIIKLKKVEKLMEAGDCEFVGEVVCNNINYGIITRYDLQRTDHFEMPSNFDGEARFLYLYT